MVDGQTTRHFFTKAIGRYDGFWSIFPFLWLLISCEPSSPPKQLTPAFYHWKAVYKPALTDKKVMREVNAKRLYLRFFDVDWDAAKHQPIPKAVVQFAERPAGLTVIPTVFITNRTMLSVPASDVTGLAQHMGTKIKQIAKEQGIRIGEVQLDCDWSLGSRDRYFALLIAVKKQLSLPVSATIRLHQIKYADRTGVPPVNRGMLMFYNMADWKEETTYNSILDMDVANRYIGFIEKYPLPLDAVLPLFRWTIVYRQGRFLTILNNVARSQLIRSTFLKNQADTNRFVALRDTTAFGISLRSGDLLRSEVCSPLALTQARRALLSRIHNQHLTFALYHLDSTVLIPYPHDFLQTLLKPITTP